LAAALGQEIGKRRITVNAVSPSFTETDMLNENLQFKEIGALGHRPKYPSH
jgi:NAD(P)-dependent dehydrogenase (short-subunit alcohol dehydrogenase family)